MKKNITKIILGIVLILSVANIVRWINGERILPWRTCITLHHPQIVHPMGDGWIVVDNGNHRLLHVNNKQHIDYIFSNNGSTSVSSGIWSFCNDSDYIYLSVTEAREGGIYSKNEQIIRYDVHSEHTDVLYYKEFGDSLRVARGEIKTLWIEGDSLHFLRYEDPTCYHQSIALAEHYSEIPSPCVIRTTIVDDPIIKAYHNAEGVVLQGKYQNTWLWSKDGLHSIDKFIPSEDTSLFNDGRRIYLSFGIFVYNILFLLSVLYILCILCVGVAKMFRRMPFVKATKHTHQQKNAVMIVLLSLLISGFYTHHVYQSYLRGYFHQICHLREQLDYIVINDYEDVLRGIAHEEEAYINDSTNRSRLIALDKMMSGMTQCPSINYEVYSDIFYVDSLGQGVNVADANCTYVFYSKMSNSKEVSHILSNPTPGSPFRIWDETGSYYASIMPYEIDGKTFCIESGCFVDDIRSASIRMVISLFFKLLILFLIVSTILSLLRRLPRHIHQFRTYRASNQSDSGIWLVGILSFLFYAISAIDQGVMVYLVYSLSEGCSRSELALRASLPMLLYMGVGMTAYLIHPLLRRRYGDRLCNMGAGVLGVCVFGLMGVSVLRGSFVCYCIGKGLSGMLMGIIFNSMYALPLLAQNKSLRNEGLASVTLSCLAANILFISVGGYLSQYLGYASVYFVNAFLCVLVFLLARVIFGKGYISSSVETNEESGHGGLREAIRFLLSGKMISYYLGILLPFGMMNAYCYYLYPMYAEKAGMSVSTLANFIVLGYAMAYILGEKLVRWKNSHNGLWVLISVFMIMAIMEITFAVSGNIIWATLVLMICCIMVAIPRSEANVFIAEQGRLRGLDVRDTNSGFAFALDATEALASPLMGWCVGAGLVVGTNLIGIISLVLTGIFAIWQRKDERKAEKCHQQKAN